MLRTWLAVLALFPLLASSPAAAAPVIIKAAHMLDGVSDKPRDNVAILVDGDRISAIGPTAEITKQAPNARVIELFPVPLATDVLHQASAQPAPPTRVAAPERVARGAARAQCEVVERAALERRETHAEGSTRRAGLRIASPRGDRGARHRVASTRGSKRHTPRGWRGAGGVRRSAVGQRRRCADDS